MSKNNDHRELYDIMRRHTAEDALSFAGIKETLARIETGLNNHLKHHEENDKRGQWLTTLLVTISVTAVTIFINLIFRLNGG